MRTHAHTEAANTDCPVSVNVSRLNWCAVGSLYKGTTDHSYHLFVYESFVFHVGFNKRAIYSFLWKTSPENLLQKSYKLNWVVSFGEFKLIVIFMVNRERIINKLQYWTAL